MSIFPRLGPAKASALPAPSGWDKCELAGKVLPAYATVTDAWVRQKLDKKKVAGSDGSFPTTFGLDPQPIHMELMTYSDADRESLYTILKPMLPASGQKSPPWSIDHASLRMIDIANVQIVGAGAMLPVAGKPGVAKMVLLMHHWLPPKAKKKSAVSTPTRSVNNQRLEAAELEAPSNPKPTAQPGFGAPPAGLGHAH